MAWGVLKSLMQALVGVVVFAFRFTVSQSRQLGSDLIWLGNQLSSGPAGMRAIGRALDPWLRAFWPLIAVVVAATTVFQHAVRQSIASTPHPELVYTIFGVGLAAAVLAGQTLSRYLRDDQMAQSLLRMSPPERRAAIEALDDCDFKTTLTLSMTPMGKHPGEHREWVENDLLACEDHLFARLNLPTYLGGSLIGIGLVGTFVGLLAALADLAGVFSALMGGNVGGAGSDPMALFSGMLVKLQEPMKGMATAFVASLYGLMGSLLLGLVVYSVRKSGEQALASVRDVLRDQDRINTQAMLEQTAEEAVDPQRWAHQIDVLNKHQELLEMLLTDLIHTLKSDALQRKL
jgi:hypothetical protein